jgi:purine-binding chemotaxis protein CheW
MSHEAGAPLLALADALAPRGTNDPVAKDVAFVAFIAGGAAFGIPLARCREVALVANIVRVPSALPLLRGLAQVRGRIVAVLDVGMLVGGGETRLERSSRLLVFDAEGRTLAILCDDVEGIARVPGAAIGRVPEALAVRAACLAGLLEREGERRFVLDPSALARAR